MEDRQPWMAGRIGHDHRKQARILVVHVAELKAVIGGEGRQAKALPVEEILRYRQGDPGARRRQCGVGHDEPLERLDVRDPRILAAATTRPSLVRRVGLKGDAHPIDAGRVAIVVEAHAGDADSRVVASSDESWKQVQLAVRPADRGRVQHTFGL